MQDVNFELIVKAVNGDKNSLSEVISSITDMVFNLSLRMLGSPVDAEDASQDIYVKVITNLSSFKGESKFSTWVYRIACNYLLDYKKSMFAHNPLSFDIYSQDIKHFNPEYDSSLMRGVDSELLTEELKLSCTNVMLQCFDAETRLIYILGTMFKADSKICGEILSISSEAYRKRLSRARQTMSEFMKEYCGLTSSDKCDCKKRICHAIRSHRLNPDELVYTSMDIKDKEILNTYVSTMDEIDDISMIFASMPKYHSPEKVKNFITDLIQSKQMKTVQHSEI